MYMHVSYSASQGTSTGPIDHPNPGKTRMRISTYAPRRETMGGGGGGGVGLRLWPLGPLLGLDVVPGILALLTPLCVCDGVID